MLANPWCSLVGVGAVLCRRVAWHFWCWDSRLRSFFGVFVFGIEFLWRINTDVVLGIRRLVDLHYDGSTIRGER